MKSGTFFIAYNFDENAKGLLESFKKEDETSEIFFDKILNVLLKNSHDLNSYILINAIENNDINGNELLFLAELGIDKLGEIISKEYNSDLNFNPNK